MENREQMSAGLQPGALAVSDRHYFDWPAIFGGAAVAIAIGVLATGFGAALGLTAFLLTAMSPVSGVAAYIAAVKGGRHRDDGRIFGGFACRR